MPAFKYPDERWGGPQEVERMYRKEKDANLAKRLNTIRLLMMGRPRTEIAMALGVSVRTIANWRDRWNQGGRETLKSKNKGRKSKVTEGVRADIEEVIEIKREINGRTVTGYLIHGYLKKKHGLDISYPQTCYVLRTMGYVRLSPRPMPIEQDEQQREEYKKKIGEMKDNPEIEIWFQDECGVVGDPKPRRVIAKKGSRPHAPYTGKHFRDNVVGAVRPSDGKFISLIMPFVNTYTFQIFVTEMQKHIGGKKVVMIMDNAAWHKSHALDWGNITPVFLPPYSPDFNPIERLWLSLKQSFFTTFVAKKHDDLSEHLTNALRFFIFNPEVCKSICNSY